MKLLLVAPYFYPKIGGLENYVYNIAQGLHKKYKWDIVVVTSNHTGNKNIKEKVKDLTIYRLAPLFKISNTPINPLWFFEIQKIIKEEKPDIINAHAPVPFIADIAARVSKRIPFVLTYHAGSMKKGKLFYDILIGIYEKVFLSHLFQQANVVICSSQFVKKTLVERYNTHNYVITPAVDITIFKPANKKRENSVLFVGRHANVYRLKGFNEVLEAMKGLPQIKLTVVGEKIATSQKNVTFLGIKSGKNLAEEMQKCRVLVLPSIAPMESFGIVLIEAMACKTPVIGTRMGGIPEVIHDKKTGLLISPKNATQLKKAILSIFSNPSSAKKMGEAGYKEVKKSFEWNNKINQTNKLLQSLL